jgi:arylsulfatase A-like enzyme
MSADDMVQRLFDELDALGETRDTLAIFTSDNGYLWGEHRIGANKRFPYTESVEVPFYLRWPGHVAAGAVDDALVANVDILPTILDTTGVTPALRYPLDGRSLLEPGERRRLLLEYWVSSDNASVPSWASIRTAAFQYVEWYAADGSVSFREYYDLRKDPYQLRNLLGDPDPSNDPVTDGLSARLAAYRTCQGSACP